MKGTNVSTKIRTGFLIMIILPIILGLAAWLKSEDLEGSLINYAAWGDIDMVMNEEVTQRLLRLENAVQAAQYRPDQKNLQLAEKSYAGIMQGLEAWAILVKNQPGLFQLAKQVQDRLISFKQRFGQFRTTQAKRKDILKQWDQIVLSALAHLHTTMEEVIDPNKEKVGKIGNIEGMNLWGDIDMIMNEAVIANFLKLQTEIHDYVADENSGTRQAMLDQLGEAKKGLSEWKEVIAGQKLMEDAAAVIDKNLVQVESLMKAYEAQASQAAKAKQEMDQAMQASLAELERGMEEVIDPAKQAAVNASQQARQETSFIIILVGGLAVLAGIILAWLISRSIINPLKRVIEGLSSGALEVASAASQVNLSSQTLAQGSSEQAASLEETSSSMEEMSSMTNQNAGNAGEANNLMQDTGEVIDQANRSMAELKQAISKISAASDDTVKIIRTIDEIAFQTNLLALNAAVEAARAGEAGAGFAVVADEVRSLALRAAEAAKSTSDLIEENLKDIKRGSELVTATDKAFGQTVLSTGKVTELVAEIASASTEQSQGIGQVNLALTELSQVTQTKRGQRGRIRCGQPGAGFTGNLHEGICG
jgi:methyl-accepting chemotaxis protein